MILRESREERLYHYREWEMDFAATPCRLVYPYPQCGGHWVKNGGPGCDFICSACRRWADAKYSGKMIDLNHVRFNCSRQPWDHYLATTLLVVRTAWDSTPNDVALLKGDGKIVGTHAPSERGTKQFGSTPYYEIQSICYPILTNAMMAVLRSEASA
jgi:hypothetical protein